jgi:hypothetical protein
MLAALFSGRWEQGGGGGGNIPNPTTTTTTTNPHHHHQNTRHSPTAPRSDEFFIDRIPTLFSHVLDWLRSGSPAGLLFRGGVTAK